MAKPDPTPKKKPAADVPPESLDKVRDILFGGQMRTVETRLKSVEERLSREQESMRVEFTKRVSDLDAFAKRETQALHERIAAENDARSAALKLLAADIKEAHKAMDKRHQKLEEATHLSDAELRDQLIAQAKAAAAELGKVHDRLAAELSRSHTELRSTKTDRAALATLFTDVAAKLGDANPKGGSKG